MKRLPFLLLLLSLPVVSLVLLTACRKTQDTSSDNQRASTSVYAARMNRRLDRSVNLGNALEAPEEGDWGMIIRHPYLDSIAAAGFTAVRIPIKWSSHALKTNPFTITPEFFDRVDEIVHWCLSDRLNIILDFHHYDEMATDPAGNKARWLELWKQIAHHYRNAPDSVFFEILNEPHDKLTAGLWNHYLKDAINLIRAENPRRMLIVGPVSWNAFDQLPGLELPHDTMLIVTYHYYLPFHFTHQGANWVEHSDDWLGTPWRGTPDEQKAIADDFSKVAAWGKEHNRPLFLGEFGAYHRADSVSRIRWTRFIRETAESLHITWAYWEFGAGFGIYDRDRNLWKKGLLQALIPDYDKQQ